MARAPGEKLREFFGQPGWQAAKTAAGLAAGGPGAWVRYSPFRLTTGPPDQDARRAT